MNSNKDILEDYFSKIGTTPPDSVAQQRMLEQILLRTQTVKEKRSYLFVGIAVGIVAVMVATITLLFSPKFGNFGEKLFPAVEEEPVFEPSSLGTLFSFDPLPSFSLNIDIVPQYLLVFGLMLAGLTIYLLAVNRKELQKLEQQFAELNKK